MGYYRSFHDRGTNELRPWIDCTTAVVLPVNSRENLYKQFRGTMMPVYAWFIVEIPIPSA